MASGMGGGWLWPQWSSQTHIILKFIVLFRNGLHPSDKWQDPERCGSKFGSSYKEAARLSSPLAALCMIIVHKRYPYVGIKLLSAV